ncbi:MAG: hypothetical protein JW797_08245 [Bradymonadales bacterium]|nr:hypothetical protein [Bradymonadales bacterium]
MTAFIFPTTRRDLLESMADGLPDRLESGQPTGVRHRAIRYPQYSPLRSLRRYAGARWSEEDPAAMGPIRAG